MDMGWWAVNLSAAYWTLRDLRPWIRMESPWNRPMADYGCRPGQLASCKMEDVGTYLELHIEQGKVLEDHGAFIGVVSGIAGLVRYTVEIRGESGHAGALP